MKKFTIYLVAISILSFFPSCKSNKSNGKDKIAVVISTLNNPWFVILANTAKQRAEELGYKAVIFDSQNDASKENSNFDDIIASGYKAILFNATDSKGSIENVRAAKKAGIPVFCMDREIDANNLAVSQILSDNYSGAVLVGQYFVKVLKGKGKYVELLGLVGDNNTWNRSKGFHSVVDNYPGLKMVAQQSADFDRNKGMEVMESILQVHPNINAVFCGNDAMAMGAYQAVLAAGKEGKILIFGFDGAADVLKAIIEGKVEATAMQFPRVMAKTAAEDADKYIKGKRDFPEKIPVAVELVTKENVQNYVPYGRAK